MRFVLNCLALLGCYERGVLVKLAMWSLKTLSKFLGWNGVEERYSYH